MLARPAAIKLIRPEMLESAGSETESRGLIARFEREAQATAALSSPHTIDLHDYGVTEEGVFYYVMELLEGIDLEITDVRLGGGEDLLTATLSALAMERCRLRVAFLDERGVGADALTEDGLDRVELRVATNVG